MTVKTTRQAQHECLCLNNALAYCKASTRTGREAVRRLPARRGRNTSMTVHHQDDRQDDEASTTRAPLPQQRSCLLQGVNAKRPRGRPQLSRREEGETRPRQSITMMAVKTTRQAQHERLCLNNALAFNKASTRNGREAVCSLLVEKKAKHVHVSPSP
jgi:hypothetical protein